MLRRVVFYFGGRSLARGKAYSRTEAERLARTMGALGFAMTRGTVEDSPTSYGYFLLDGPSLMGTGKGFFMDYVQEIGA